MTTKLYHALTEIRDHLKIYKKNMNSWECRFMADTLARFAEYEGKTFFSDKQERRVITIYNNYRGLK